MGWLWTIGIILLVLIVTEALVIYGERFLSEWLPRWKTELAAWGAVLFGVIVQLDPTLFAPLFGDSKYTGLAIALLGIVFRNLRQITFTAGSRVPGSVAAAGAAQTLVTTSQSDLKTAVKTLESEPVDNLAETSIVVTAIRQKA